MNWGFVVRFGGDLEQTGKVLLPFRRCGGFARDYDDYDGDEDDYADDQLWL